MLKTGSGMSVFPDTAGDVFHDIFNRLMQIQYGPVLFARIFLQGRFGINGHGQRRPFKQMPVMPVIGHRKGRLPVTAMGVKPFTDILYLEQAPGMRSDKTACIASVDNDGFCANGFIQAEI